MPRHKPRGLLFAAIAIVVVLAVGFLVLRGGFGDILGPPAGCEIGAEETGLRSYRFSFPATEECVGGPGPYDRAYWDYGDQRTDDAVLSGGEFSGDHRYAQDGTYTVTLTVIDSSDIAHYFTTEITVRSGP